MLPHQQGAPWQLCGSLMSPTGHSSLKRGGLKLLKKLGREEGRRDGEEGMKPRDIKVLASTR